MFKIRGPCPNCPKGDKVENRSKAISTGTSGSLSRSKKKNPGRKVG